MFAAMNDLMTHTLTESVKGAATVLSAPARRRGTAASGRKHFKDRRALYYEMIDRELPLEPHFVNRIIDTPSTTIRLPKSCLNMLAESGDFSKMRRLSVRWNAVRYD